MRGFHNKTVLGVAMTSLAIVASAGLALSAGPQSDRITVSLDPSFYAAGPRLKVENQVVILWAPSSEVSPDGQVQVFNLEGSEITSINLLELLPKVRKVTITDVSVGPTGMIAVGARIFTKPKQSEPSLLFLDGSGALTISTVLDKGLGALKVEVDEEENVWVLGLGAGVAGPAEVPVLTKYDRDGNLLGEYLHFSDFSEDAKLVHEGMTTGGDVSMGWTSSNVWFWLASSRELVTISRDGSGVVKVPTGLPTPTGTGVNDTVTRARRFSWVDSLGLLAQVSLSPKSPNGESERTQIYQLVSGATDWKVMPQADLANHAGTFLGVDQNNAEFAIFEPDQASIEIDSVPLAP
jgi:hypothetical protein